MLALEAQFLLVKTVSIKTMHVRANVPMLSNANGCVVIVRPFSPCVAAMPVAVSSSLVTPARSCVEIANPANKVKVKALAAPEKRLTTLIEPIDIAEVAIAARHTRSNGESQA